MATNTRKVENINYLADHIAGLPAVDFAMYHPQKCVLGYAFRLYGSGRDIEDGIISVGVRYLGLTAGEAHSLGFRWTRNNSRGDPKRVAWYLRACLARGVPVVPNWYDKLPDPLPSD